MLRRLCFKRIQVKIEIIAEIELIIMMPNTVLNLVEKSKWLVQISKPQSFNPYLLSQIDKEGKLSN